MKSSTRWEKRQRSGCRIILIEGVMPSPYGLDVIDSCLSCKLRQFYLFCHLSPDSVKQLEEIKSTVSYPKGAVLFVAGQQPRGVFILCQGRAKLSTSSSDGRTVILRIAQPGEVLGLSAVVSGRPCLATAELIEPAQANFIRRADLLKLLENNGEVALRAAQLLSNQYHSAYETVHTLGVSHSATEKLARLLLQWAAAGKPVEDGIRVTVTLKHEEIAQLLGTSRETVTRLFAKFKSQRLLTLKGSTLIIRDKAALESLVRG